MRALDVKEPDRTGYSLHVSSARRIADMARDTKERKLAARNAYRAAVGLPPIGPDYKDEHK